MKTNRPSRFRNSEAGVALLVAIFILLLISAVAISLIIASGTESSLAANYRSSTSAYYASQSGMEEARGRLMPKSPNAYDAAFIGPGGSLALGAARYVVNPGPGEPATLALLDPPYYPDNEYKSEFPGAPVPATRLTRPSVLVAGLPGPLYKWVRINAITEDSIKVKVNGGAAGALDTLNPLYYNGSNLLPPTNTDGAQALQLTSLAVLPDGSQKMLRYIVAPLAPINVKAAIHARGSAVVGSAVDVTGFKDLTCAGRPDAFAIMTQGAAGTSGSGNLTGGPPPGNPAGAVEGPFPYNLTRLINAVSPQALPIDSTGTGVTGAGSPVLYSGPHATLGVLPTTRVYGDVDPDVNKLKSMSNDGIPANYYSPSNLVLGTSASGAPVTGNGALIVKGNLTIDITNGFEYFGLIIVTGDVTMIANPIPEASAHIHGTIILGGDFKAPISNLSGSIFIHQNACLVPNLNATVPYAVLSFRELTQ